MISSLFSLAVLALGASSVSGFGIPSVQVDIDASSDLSAKEAFDIFLSKLVDQNGNIPYAGTPYFDNGSGGSQPTCNGADFLSKVMTFQAGAPDTNIDNGIVIQGTCNMVAHLNLLQQTQANGQYYFFTYAGNTGPNGGALPQSYEIDINGIKQSDFDTTELPQQPHPVFNSGTSQVSLALPAGTTEIRIRLISNLLNSSGAAVPKPAKGLAYIFLSPVQITGSQVSGDPQFTGFLNQKYQIHGSDNTVYNIISSENFQYNALFKFLSEGKCRQGTACFSHPGNYFGEVGLLVKDSTSGKISKIRVIAGDVETGLSMEVDGSKSSVGDKIQIGDYTITLLSQYEVSVESKEFNLILQNSDKFLNQLVSIGSSLFSKIKQYKLAQKTGASTESMKMPHGLLGQTFEMKTYDNIWKYIQGDLLQYIQADGQNDIFSTQNHFNRF